MMPSTSTLSHLILSTDSSTKEQFQVNETPRVHRRLAGASAKKVQNAVYAYLRAIRALGRTGINTGDVAMALSLPVGDVNKALSALKKKGVRVLNG
jgi:hypothetical protein